MPVKHITNGSDWVQISAPKKKQSTNSDQKVDKQIMENVYAQYLDSQKTHRSAVQQPPTQQTTREQPVEEQIFRGQTVIPHDKRIKLTQLREAKQLTRTQLAHQSHISQQIVDDYENGKGIYNPSMYNRLIQFLGRVPPPPPILPNRNEL